MARNGFSVQDWPLEVVSDCSDGTMARIRLLVPTGHHEESSVHWEELLAFEQHRSQLFITMAPTAQQWFRHHSAGALIVGLRPEARSAVSYILHTCARPCAAIDWSECYVDEGLACLPQLPRTLKRLKIRNCAQPFPNATQRRQGVSGCSWVPDRFQHLETLELINCSTLATDLGEVRTSLPGVAVIHKNYGLPKMLSHIEAEWKVQKTPKLAVELASRYMMLRNPKWKAVVRQSLAATIEYYLNQGTIESALRVVPWAALAAVYGESELARDAKSYLEKAPEVYQLPERFSQCVDCSLTQIWNVTTYLTRSTRGEIAEILEWLEGY